MKEKYLFTSLWVIFFLEKHCIAEEDVYFHCVRNKEEWEENSWSENPEESIWAPSEEFLPAIFNGTDIVGKNIFYIQFSPEKSPVITHILRNPFAESCLYLKYYVHAQENLAFVWPSMGDFPWAQDYVLPVSTDFRWKEVLVPIRYPETSTRLLKNMPSMHINFMEKEGAYFLLDELRLVQGPPCRDLREVKNLECPPESTMSTTTEGWSTASDALSTSTKALSTTTERWSTSSEALSTSTESISTASEALSTSSEALSTSTESISTASEALSTASKALSTSSAETPTATSPEPSTPSSKTPPPPPLFFDCVQKRTDFYWYDPLLVVNWITDADKMPPGLNGTDLLSLDLSGRHPYPYIAKLILNPLVHSRYMYLKYYAQAAPGHRFVVKPTLNGGEYDLENSYDFSWREALIPLEPLYNYVEIGTRATNGIFYIDTIIVTLGRDWDSIEDIKTVCPPE